MGELILKHTDNLIKTLQKEKLSAVEGQKIVALKVKSLQSIRSDVIFGFNETPTADRFDRTSKFTQRRKNLYRLQIGSAKLELPESPIAYFRASYLVALELATCSYSVWSSHDSNYSEPACRSFCQKHLRKKTIKRSMIILSPKQMT